MTHLQKWKQDGGYTYEGIAYDLHITGYPAIITDDQAAQIFKGKVKPGDLMIKALKKLTGLSRAQILNEE